MTKKTKTTKAKRIVNLLILYQGEEAKTFADGIAQPLSKDLPGDIHCEHRQVGYHEDKSDTHVFDLYLKDMAWADASIAIVAFDPRFASKTGNIWFEIGWWYAKKPPGTILICLQENENVSTVSDNAGIVAPKFSDLRELVEKAKDLVQDVASKKYPEDKPHGERYHPDGRYSDTCKLMDTLGLDRWPPGGVFTCEHLILRPQRDIKATSGQDKALIIECDFRKQSVILVSELMRMARANRENAEVQNAFFQFAKYASEALATDSTSFDHRDASLNETHRDDKRQKALEKMVEWLGKLGDTISELMLPRSQLYLEPAVDAWEKLRCFIEYRVKTAIKNRKRMLGLQFEYPQMQVLLVYAKPFTSWARDLLHANSNFRQNAYFLKRKTKGEESEQEANQIADHCKLAEGMAVLLDYMGQQYFRTCRNVIKAILESANPFHDIRQTFSNIRVKLPHNNHRDFQFPDIWPDKKGAARA